MLYCIIITIQSEEYKKLISFSPGWEEDLREELTNRWPHAAGEGELQYQSGDGTETTDRVCMLHGADGHLAYNQPARCHCQAHLTPGMVNP